MASTGLLGFNPYQQGVAIDISSKPTQLAIQLQQREDAKKDALEKYYMDYEKTLNPKGLSADETKIFLQKYNDNKNFWIKNKDAILNPSKYGYDAQSQYMANIKDQLSYIEEGKKATAEREALTDYVAKERGKGNDISDNIIEIAKNAAKPVRLGYISPDYSQIQVFKPHDPSDYLKELKNVKRISGTPKIGRLGNYDVISYDEIPDINEAKQIANGKLQNDMGYKKYISNLAQDPQQLSGLGKLYEQRTGSKFNPQSLQDVSFAYTLSGLPIEKSKPVTRTNLQAQSSAIASRQRPYSADGIVGGQIGNILDNFGSTNAIVYPKGGTKIEKGIVTDKNGNLFNGKVYIPKNQIPADLYTALTSYGIDKDFLAVNEGFEASVKEGRIQGLKGENLPFIDRITVENAQRKLDTERKGEKGMGFSNTQNTTPTHTATPKQQQPQSTNKGKNVKGKKDDKL